MSQQLSSFPKLRSDLRFHPVSDGGDFWYVIEDPIGHQFYRIGSEEYRFICLLSQFSTIEEVLENFTLQTGIIMDEQQAGRMLAWLGGRQLLNRNDPNILRQVRQQEEVTRHQQRLNRLNLVTFKLPLINPRSLLRRIEPWMGWLNGKASIVVWVVLGVIALLKLGEKWSLFLQQASGFFSPVNLMWIWLIWFGLKLLHELYHALVCRRYGGEIYEAGMLFILFVPLTYINATSSWTFPSKWQRIHVALAGIFGELLVAFIAILVWESSPDSIVGSIAHNTVIIAGASSILFNLNPLMRYDGYYILSDLIGIPNLYFLSLQEVRAIVTKFFLGTATSSTLLNTDNRLFIRLYGVAINIWRILVVVSLGWLASRIGGGLGLPIALMAVFIWIVLPLKRFIQSLPEYKKKNPNALRRLSIRGGSVFVTLFFFIWFSGWQEHIEAHGVVEYRQQHSVHTLVDGFVRKVLVANGQPVTKGMPLVILSNDQLSSQAVDLQLRLQQKDINIRIAYGQEKLTDLQILKQERQVIENQYDAVMTDLAALSVCAPADGTVIADSLDETMDTYLPKGSELLWIVSPQQKVLTVSFSQQDIHALEKTKSSLVAVDMQEAGFGIFPGTLSALQTIASNQLPNPALAGVYGGPLDVRQIAMGSKDSMQQKFQLELYSPRITGYVSLPEKILHKAIAGQTALVNITGPRIKLTTWAVRLIKGWLHDKSKSKESLTE